MTSTTSNDLKNKRSVLGRAFAARAVSVLKSPQWHRRAAWAIVGLLLLWALAWAAVPSLLKSQLEKIASEKLGRQVTVGAVHFKPWSLELTLNDLVIAKNAKIRPAANQANPVSTAPDGARLKIRRIYIDARCRAGVPAAAGTCRRRDSWTTRWCR